MQLVRSSTLLLSPLASHRKHKLREGNTIVPYTALPTKGCNGLGRTLTEYIARIMWTLRVHISMKSWPLERAAPCQQMYKHALKKATHSLANSAKMPSVLRS